MVGYAPGGNSCPVRPVTFLRTLGNEKSTIFDDFAGYAPGGNSCKVRRISNLHKLDNEACTPGEDVGEAFRLPRDGEPVPYIKNRQYSMIYG